MLLSYLTAAADEPQDWSSNKLLLVIVAALFGFLSGYLLELFKAKRGPRTVLSWDLKVEEPQLSYSTDKSERLKITYLDQKVDRLVSVRYSIANTGNTPIKGQTVRFKVPVDAKILGNCEVDPAPEPEQGVVDITGEDPAFAGPRYKIAHLDPGESVSFFLASDGGNWRDWTGAILKNDECAVVYQRRDVAQRRDDQAHVARFLFGLVAIFIITTLTAVASLTIGIMARFNLVELAFFGIVILLTIALASAAAYLLAQAYRATRAIAQWWKLSSLNSISLTAAGGQSWFAYAPSGEIRIGARDDGEHST